MAELKVTDEMMEWLRVKANAAYVLLRRCVDENPKLIPSAECLYKNDLGDYLREITFKSTSSFRRLNKGGKRAGKIEEFILQHVLMCGDSKEVDGNLVEIEEDPQDGMGGLKAFIDAEDDRNTVEGVVFRQIRRKAAQLREEGKYGMILKAMDYVRGRYPL